MVKPSVLLLALGIFIGIALTVTLLANVPKGNTAESTSPDDSTTKVEVVFPTQLPPLVVTFPTEIPPMYLQLTTATPIPTPTPTPSPTAAPQPATSTPIPEPTIATAFPGYRNYKEKYLLPDGLKASVDKVEIRKLGNVTNIKFNTSLENTSPNLIDGGRFALYYEGDADAESLEEMGFEKTVYFNVDRDGEQVQIYHPNGWAIWIKQYQMYGHEDMTPSKTIHAYSNINIQSLDPNGKLYIAYPSLFTVERQRESIDEENWELIGEMPTEDLVWRIK